MGQKQSLRPSYSFVFWHRFDRSLWLELATGLAQEGWQALRHRRRSQIHHQDQEAVKPPRRTRLWDWFRVSRAYPRSACWNREAIVIGERRRDLLPLPKDNHWTVRL